MAAAAATAVACLVLLTCAGAARADSWTIQSTPAIPGATNAVLKGVTCPTSTSCLAVGSYEDSSGHQEPLAESWNGRTWTVDAVPVPISENPNRPTTGELNAVSCSGAEACTAVGDYAGSPTPNGQPLAERWDGTGWTQQTLPAVDFSVTGVALDGVSCASATACVAVGWYGQAAEYFNLAEVWDGTAWTQTTTPQHPAGVSGDTDNYLFSVSCAAAGSCSAAGTDGDGYNLHGTDVLHWDGSSWTSQTTPDGPQSGPTHQLNGISCASAASCEAVGGVYGFPDAPAYTAIAEAWDGASWTPDSAAQGSGSDSLLNGVSCSPGTPCVAVGESGTASDPSSLRTLAEVRGEGWTVQSTANVSGATDNVLNGVSCTADGWSCTAVGTSSAGALVERSQVAAAQPPVVSTSPASAVTGTRAELHATVDPEGSAVTSCDLQWGTSAAVYTHTVPCPTPPGSGSAPVSESVALTGLVPGTSYQYRIVATNGVGRTVGTDKLFATPARGGASTLGNASVGDEVSSFQSGLERVNPYALYWPGVARALSVYLQPTGVRGRQSVQLMIYADHDGLPGALLSQTLRFRFKSSDTGGWYRLRLRHSVALADGTYWIGVLTGGRAGVAGWRYDDTGLRETRYTPFGGGPTGPFGATGHDAAVMSLYANLMPLPHQSPAMTRREHAAMLDHHAGQLGRRHGLRHSGRPR